MSAITRSNKIVTQVDNVYPIRTSRHNTRSNAPNMTTQQFIEGILFQSADRTGDYTESEFYNLYRKYSYTSDLNTKYPDFQIIKISYVVKTINLCDNTSNMSCHYRISIALPNYLVGDFREINVKDINVKVNYDDSDKYIGELIVTRIDVA
jgi:hypothetical protein